MSMATAELMHIRFQKLKNIHFSIVHIHKGIMHEHSSLEVGLVLNGRVTMEGEKGSRQIGKGGLLLINPYESHLIDTDSDGLMLVMQFAPGFGEAYFARMGNVAFDSSALDTLPPEVYNEICRCLINSAKAYFSEPDVFGLECASYAAQLATTLLRYIPYEISTDAELLAKRKKNGRMQRISGFIEQNYRQKLTLAQIAEAEQVTTTYMSRIFVELFHMNFQEYLSEFRLHKALPLLKNPSVYLVDVCMECGFSDTRYLNAVCKKQYGCNASQLRQMLIEDRLHPSEMVITQSEVMRLTDGEALRRIEEYLKSI